MALPPDLDEDKLSEAALAILGLTAFRDRGAVRAWKGMDWDLLAVLFDRGWIEDPKGPARSVVLTDEGARLAPDLLARHFGRRNAKKDSPGSTVYRLKVALRGSRPPVWRRLEVPAGVTLSRFHEILQAAMGWTNSHLHQFERGSTRYGTPDPDLGLECEDERRVRLIDILRKPRERMVYEYDFGDGWLHDIVLEAATSDEAERSEACVVAGKGACPPEDVGGIGGYYNFLEAIRDPQHPERDDMVRWGGGTFDPDAFDLDAVNRRFPGHRRRGTDARDAAAPGRRRRSNRGR